jgi:CheY-like chemotaxis protein
MTSVENRDLLEAAKPDSRTVPRKPGILVVDDMGLILTLLKFALEQRGFTVWLAVDGDDAIDVYRRNREEIDLVLLDVQMPGLDGPHTLAFLQLQNPDVLACFMTGDAGTYTEAALLGCGAVDVFNKPFSATKLAQSVHALLLAGVAPAGPLLMATEEVPCEH